MSSAPSYDPAIAAARESSARAAPAPTLSIFDATMITVGIVIGAVLAMFTSRWLTAFLVGVRARDPLTLGAAALVITAVTAVAAYVPARRASRIDPLVALRSD